MVDFTSVLNKKADDLQKPVPKPVGTYVCQVVGLPKQKTVVGKDTGEEMPVVTYTVRPIMAKDDVDPDELKTQPPISQWGNFQRTIDFFLHTEGGQFYHSEFLANVLDIPSDDKTVGERMVEAPGKQLLVAIKHAPYVNKQGQPEIGIELAGYAHT